MRRGLIVILAMFLLVTGMVYVFAQDRPPAPDPGEFGRPGAPERGDRGEQPQRPNRQQRQPGIIQRMGGGPVVMELSGDTLFLVQGTMVYKIDTKVMELKAQKDLAEAATGAAGADDVIKRFDRDGDGLVSPQEWPGPEAMFRELDADGSGTLDKSELPQELLDRAKRMGATNRIAPGPASIKVGEKSLFVFLSGYLFKMKIADLEVEGSLQLEQPQVGPQERPQRDIPQTDEERRRQRLERMEKREKRQGGQEEDGAEQPKKKGDDFGF